MTGHLTHLEELEAGSCVANRVRWITGDGRLDRLEVVVDGDDRWSGGHAQGFDDVVCKPKACNCHASQYVSILQTLRRSVCQF